MRGDACCIVLDCRRTGKPNAPGRPFICAKHMAAAGEATVKEFHQTHGTNQRSGGRSSHWRFLEQSTWERICAAVAQTYELKPKASSPTTSGI